MNDLRQHLIDVWAEVKQSVIDGASGADVTIRARGPDPYRAKDINKLEMVQRRAARFAKSDYCRTTPVSKLLDRHAGTDGAGGRSPHLPRRWWGEVGRASAPLVN